MCVRVNALPLLVHQLLGHTIISYPLKHFCNSYYFRIKYESFLHRKELIQTDSETKTKI
jgi:hypothetical protein